MGCCKKSEWRNERTKIQDHKFDFVDIDEFYERSYVRKIRYSLVFLVLLKTILVYIADLWTAGILLIFDRWGSSVKPKIPFYISKWIYVGAILMSFIILAWDIKKAVPIVASRDISYTFTSLVATRFYTLRSYAHYCFFCQIQESSKFVDSIAFFIFFTFKGWKRLVFAELPRQAVNAFTIVSIIQSNNSRRYWDITTYGDNIVQRLAVALMAFTLAVFILSFSMLCVAFILYIPLLCHIRGNLKEYCCHKVDKRIAELIKLRSKKRIQKNKKQAEAIAKGDYSHLKKKKGDALPPKEPTIPVLNDDDHSAPPYTHVGVPPAYVSRPGSPNISRPGTPSISRPGTPNISRPGTPNYSRSGTPAYRSVVPSRPGTPGYGQVKSQTSTRRNSISSVMSGMTNVSSHSTSSYGGYGIPNIPNRSQTPPIKRGYDNNLVARAILNNRQTYASERSDSDDDRFSEYGGSQYGGSQSSLGDNTGSKPLLNKYNEHDLYRTSSPARSYSPTPSVSSNPRPRGTQGSFTSRQQDNNRTAPRYNNYSSYSSYSQQGGGPNRGN